MRCGKIKCSESRISRSEKDKEKGQLDKRVGKRWG